MTQATVTVERPVKNRPQLWDKTVGKLAKAMRILNAANEQEAIDAALTVFLEKKEKGEK